MLPAAVYSIHSTIPYNKENYKLEVDNAIQNMEYEKHFVQHKEAKLRQWRIPWCKRSKKATFLQSLKHTYDDWYFKNNLLVQNHCFVGNVVICNPNSGERGARDPPLTHGIKNKVNLNIYYMSTLSINKQILQEISITIQLTIVLSGI